GEVLDRALELARTPQAQAALANLEEIWQLSRAHGVGAHVKLDLALVRDVSYYTGMVLEGLVEDVGYLLVTGGRYDDLVARFGRPLPATGFAVGLERLLLALERQGVWGLPPASGPLFITFDPARREEALAAAARLREGGCPVEVEVSRRDEVAQRGYARQRRVRLWARFLEGERGMVRVEPPDDEAGSRVKPVAEWVAEVLRAREEGGTAGGRARGTPSAGPGAQGPAHHPRPAQGSAPGGGGAPPRPGGLARAGRPGPATPGGEGRLGLPPGPPRGRAHLRGVRRRGPGAGGERRPPGAGAGGGRGGRPGLRRLPVGGGRPGRIGHHGDRRAGLPLPGGHQVP